MQTELNLFPPDVSLSPELFRRFPSTRYQGSKRKLLPLLAVALAPFAPSTVLDLYSGTSSVSLLLRTMGCSVVANDYTLYNYTTARLFLTATQFDFELNRFRKTLDFVFLDPGVHKRLVSENFGGIYFKEEENAEIDVFCHNIASLPTKERDLMIYLMGQAMLMKRPYNLFHRANLGMRTKDVPRTFGNAKTWETSFKDHMFKLFLGVSKFPFNGPLGRALNLNSIDLENFEVEPDIIYLDPPYLNKFGIGVDYANFYNFLEGLVNYELFGKGDQKYPHKPIVRYQAGWETEAHALAELKQVMVRWPRAVIALSYRGDGRPSIEKVTRTFHSMHYSQVSHVVSDYKYALSSGSESSEELLIMAPKERSAFGI